ncbi:dihydroxyacetone phosphate acyltransferase [Nasonia vitripennis]|uniref:Phospholipid/glycerol acyltransferase domain-containing protein n=1 Tax=Nasonia vitripennis TaxID=7425 RepID=A0A7M7G5C7_NASVI|nr:dihydroxyacetone phosphate acyltransferase [Nasonia vitripennis]
MKPVDERFVDLLEERRKDYDVVWVSRSMKPLTPHRLSPDVIYTRKQTIEAALSDNRVMGVIQALAAARGVPVSTIVAEAQDILHEMASKAHLPTVRWLALLITKVLKRILMSIRLNESLLYILKDQMSILQVQYVYAPTHRSYLDFILLSYVLFSYDMALPNIASGMDFYRMKIVGELLRHTGAFYIRRSFASDPFYKEIFRAYVGSLVAHSDRAIEFFIEGTRSRSQKTLAPKFGFLSTILDGLFRSNVPDIQFIPISISYDKPLEELLFAYELLGVPKPAESTTGLFRSLSILKEPFGHGNVYLKIAPPISAREYLDMTTRKASALSPNAKLPSQVTKRVAYAIVDCHKQNTVLTPFNLISLLYNERIHSHPREPYSLDDLLLDYSWIKNIFVQRFQAIVNPAAANTSITDNAVDDTNKQEVLESLKTHNNLLEIDFEQNVKLKNRHTGVTQLKNIKGYPLSEKTLKIAVPVINLMIYVNPVFAYLSKPAIAALCINLSSKESALRRYSMLRTVFSNEFALPTNMSESELVQEWEETIQSMAKDKFIQQSSENQLSINNDRLHSILCNLITPFVASLQTICKTLLQWDYSTHCIEKNVIKECQKRVEESLYEETALIKHPYSLSLDTYTTLLSSLVTCEYVTIDKCGLYNSNRSNMEEMVDDLDKILNQCSKGFYVEILSSLIPEEMTNIRAKL